MEFLPRKLRPAIKCHGGKYYLARRIIQLVPEHRVYCEPFAGGLSILLNKPPAPLEIAGDINEELINFYCTVSSYSCVMRSALHDIPYSESTFSNPDPWYETSDVGKAMRFLIKNRMSRDGLGKRFAWSDRLRGGQPGDVNAWKTAIESLPDIASRIRKVEFWCRNAVELIRENDGPDTLFYCDPPYLPETRTARQVYQYEMSWNDHSNLLDELLWCRGTVMLSGYPSQLYQNALSDWRRIEFDMPNHAGQGRTKQRRTEILWINHPSILDARQPSA